MMDSFHIVRHREHGAALVVSLLLLLVMTLLALAASHATQLQERMAGNQRDTEIALQSAEASLRAAEELLAPTKSVDTCTTADPVNCEAYAALPASMSQWWNSWARTYTPNLGQVATKPQFVIEHLAESHDSLSVGGSYLNLVRDFHRVTARSSGMTETAQVVVQSTHARISFE
jgi:type IV pilus assembly protein PilX